MTPRPSSAGIRTLCLEAGCTPKETEALTLLADYYSVESAAAELRIGRSQFWRRRQSAKRRIREHYGLNPDDDNFLDGVESRRDAVIELRSRGHSERYIANRVGISQQAVNRIIQKCDWLSSRVEGYTSRFPKPADADEVESFRGGASRKSADNLDHWSSSTGIDPFLEPGSPGGPPVYPMTTRRVGDE